MRIAKRTYGAASRFAVALSQGAKWRWTLSALIRILTQFLLITSTLHFRRAAPQRLSCANARTAPDDTNCRRGLSL